MIGPLATSRQILIGSLGSFGMAGGCLAQITDAVRAGCRVRAHRRLRCLAADTDGAGDQPRDGATMSHKTESIMTHWTTRLERLEQRLLPPPTRTVRLVAATPDGTHPQYPADLGPDDMMVVLVGVRPAAELTP